MQKIFYLWLGLLCFPFFGNSQRLPFFMPEDVESTSLNVKCFCSPGVKYKSRSRGLELSFLRTFKSELRNEKGLSYASPFSESSINRIKFTLRFPLINKDNLKIIGGLLYRPEQFRFTAIGAEFENVFERLDKLNLKSSGVEFIVVKPLNEKIYTTFRARAVFNGDYREIINFEKRFAVYNFSAAIGIKKNKYKEWAFGLNYSDSFRRSILLPFVIYNHTFNERWGIESVLPAMINLRHNLSKESIFLLGLKFSSSSYSLKLDDNPVDEIFALNHSEIKLTLNLEQKFSEWFWMDFAIGYQYNFNSDFEAKINAASSFQIRPQNTPFFKVGIFLSPPDKYMN